MGLFNFGKKKEAKCCCGGAEISNIETEINSHCILTDTGIQNIKVLGSGCKYCHELYENTKEAVNEMGLLVEVEYVTDMEKVMTYGAMSMPVLVANEKVISQGKVLKKHDIEKLLRKIGY